MNSSVTVSVRTLVATGVALAALVAAYLLGATGGGTPARAASPSAPPGVAAAGVAAGSGGVRTLSVTGRGEVTAVPDRLGFRVAVAVTRPELADALTSSSRTLRRVLAALTPYGVRRADVQTTGLSMDPVYDYPRYGPPTLRGYRVSQRAAVLVRDLAQGGRAVSAAVAAGGNRVRVDGIRLQVGDPEAALARARDAAVADARARAERYAAASGQTLGAVLTLREVSPARRAADHGSWGVVRSAADAPVPALPVRAGRTDVGVSVQVVWEFGGSAR